MHHRIRTESGYLPYTAAESSTGQSSIEMNSWPSQLGEELNGCLNCECIVRNSILHT